MKIAYLGHGDFGYRCLQDMLAAGIKPVLCCAHAETADLNTGRSYPDLQHLCSDHSIPFHVVAPRDKEILLQHLESFSPDLIVTVTWRGLLPQKIIDMPRYGAINLHGSLLPKYRGNAPVTWALLNEDQEIGATIHYTDAGMDTGDIIEQIRFPVSLHDTVGTILDKLLNLDGLMLVRAIRKIESGSFTPIKQNHAQATIAAKRKPEDALIDWNMPARTIYNEIRAQTKPLPGAFTLCNGEKLHIWGAGMIEIDHGGAPGSILAFETMTGANVQFPVVATGKGLLVITDADAIEKFTVGTVLG